jgi:hypothetical protein
VARLFAACLALAAGPARACPELPVAPDALDPYEPVTGATNVNAALGSGRLTAGFSRCGELTVLKWPGPSYYDQLDYLTSNAADARQRPHLGALDTQGAFPGVSYRLRGHRGWQHTWLRDDGWERSQRYSSDDSDVLVQEATNAALGLHVTAYHFVLPDSDVLVNDYLIERAPGSPVGSAKLVFYANFAPTQGRLPLFQVSDWALDFQNDFAALFDSRERALLHFVPKTGNRDFSVLNPLLAAPPRTQSGLRREVRKLVERLTAPGVYIAMAPRRRQGFRYQIGFDDAPTCSHQSEFADRALGGYDLPPEFQAVARGLFVCETAVPEGPLARCREANGWTYTAESAFRDAQDGRLSRSPIAACQANAALARPLRFRDGVARATFYLAAAGTRDEAYGLLRAARSGDPDAQRAETEAWWAKFIAPARLPDTDDPIVTAVSKRALISIRTATDAASGAIVASITTQPAYGADWPRDGAFINDALDLAGYPDIVTRHNRFYARVQRKQPGPWSFVYSFPPCNPAAPVYPNCIPPGTFEMNYYADPDAVVPANFISFEIDQAGQGVRTMWEHAGYIDDPGERAEYLADVCPSIALGATNLAECRDPVSGLQCFASVGDDTNLTQHAGGAYAVLIALRSAISAKDACGFSPTDVAAWQGRYDELSRLVLDTFLVLDPPAHLPRIEIGAQGVGGLVDLHDPIARSHAEWLSSGVTNIVNRTASRTFYTPLHGLATFYRALGDQAALAELQDQVRFFMSELTTPDTRHTGESTLRVAVDLNGDGVSPDYLPVTAVPHVWQGSRLYVAAMAAFGSR